MKKEELNLRCCLHGGGLAPFADFSRSGLILYKNILHLCERGARSPRRDLAIEYPRKETLSDELSETQNNFLPQLAVFILRTGVVHLLSFKNLPDSDARSKPFFMK